MEAPSLLQSASIETYGTAVKAQVDEAVERRAVYDFVPDVLRIST